MMTQRDIFNLASMLHVFVGSGYNLPGLSSATVTVIINDASVLLVDVTSLRVYTRVKKRT